MTVPKNYSASELEADYSVSRETIEALKTWEILLYRWNRKINLVSKAGLNNFWKRHILDSWQLLAHVPQSCEKLIDLGSGAGFPGLALAIGFKARGKGHVTLVESAGKKTNFLKTVIRDLTLPAFATSERAEALPSKAYDVVTARAFAPLDKLLGYAHPFWGQDTIGLFLKGINATEELTEARKYWTFALETVPSQSDPEAVLLKISGLKPLSDHSER